MRDGVMQSMKIIVYFHG